MGSFEERVLKELETLRSLQMQMGGLATIQQRLDELDDKFGEQVARLDQVQAKVNLSASSIGQIHQEQVQAARAMKASAATVGSVADRRGGLQDCWRARPWWGRCHQQQHQGDHHHRHHRRHRQITGVDNKLRGRSTIRYRPCKIQLRNRTRTTKGSGCQRWNFQSLMEKEFECG